MFSFEAMIQYMNHLPQNDSNRIIVRYMLKNLRKIKDMSINDLAEACFTSPATVSRLIKKMDFLNYTQFQQSLEDYVSQYAYLNRILPLHEMYRKGDNLLHGLELIEGAFQEFRERYDPELFDNIASILHNSNFVVFFHLGISFGYALQIDLIMDGVMCELASGRVKLEEIPELDEHSVFFIVQPKLMNTAQIEEACRYAKKIGAKIIVVTNTKSFSIIKDADISYTFQGTLNMIDDIPFQLFLLAVDIHYRENYLDA